MRGLLAGGLLMATVGCGEDEKQTGGFTGFATNQTLPTTPATTPGTTPGTGESSDSSSDTGTSTMPVDPSTGVEEPTTSTTAPPTSTPTTEPPGTTTTEPPPETTDESTTSTTDGTTTTTTTMGMTTTTTMGMTTNPPPKDPQPASGLYSNCFPSDMCPGLANGGCLTLQDADMVAFDGFCTLLCNTAADCTPKPNSPAVSQCLFINDMQKTCFLECGTDADCPTGMTCELVALPQGDGSYCW